MIKFLQFTHKIMCSHVCCLVYVVRWRCPYTCMVLCYPRSSGAFMENNYLYVRKKVFKHMLRVHFNINYLSQILLHIHIISLFYHTNIFLYKVNYLLSFLCLTLIKLSTLYFCLNLNSVIVKCTFYISTLNNLIQFVF